MYEYTFCNNTVHTTNSKGWNCVCVCALQNKSRFSSMPINIWTVPMEIGREPECYVVGWSFDSGSTCLFRWCTNHIQYGIFVVVYAFEYKHILWWAAATIQRVSCNMQNKNTSSSIQCKCTFTHFNGNIFWGDIELRQFDYYLIFIRHKMFRIKLIIFISLFSSLFTNSYCIGRIRCGIYLFFRLFVQS